MTEWLTPKDVAKMLKVSRATAYKIINEFIENGGKHWRPTQRLTRVEPEDFKKYLEKK